MSSPKVLLPASARLIAIPSLQGRFAVSRDGSLILVGTHRQVQTDQAALWLPLTGADPFVFRFWQNQHGLEDAELAVEIPTDRVQIVLHGESREVHVSDARRGELAISGERAFVLGKPNVVGGMNAISVDGGYISREVNGEVLAASRWGLRGYCDDELVLEADFTAGS